MKKETFRQKCVRLNNTINDNPLSYELGVNDRSLAIEKILPAHVIASKRKAYCSHCGSEVRVTTQKECPVCHKAWGTTTHVSKASTYRRYGYLCVMDVMEGLQVLRFWYVGYDFHVYKQTEYLVIEVERQFFNSDGDRYGFSLSKPMFTFGQYDAWNFYSKITIKNLHQRYYGYYGDTTTPRFNLPCHVTIIKKTIYMLKRNGLRKSMHGMIYPAGIVMGLLSDNQVETLWKSRQFTLAEYVVNCRNLSPSDMASVRICNRNRYRVKDAKLWLDHLQTLTYLNLDTRNAHYVCPKNLVKEHGVMIERQNRQRERIEAERKARNLEEQLKRMEKDNENYQKRWGRLLSISIDGDNLSIRPLQDVNEFKQEGDAMHHCVFGNKYYTSESSIILSAKDRYGNRLATIEYDIERFEIAQCRAVCNRVPERDEEIRHLIDTHRHDFERLLTAA